MIGDRSRVALRRRPSQTGKVTGRPINDWVYVRWDVGGGGNVHVNNLLDLSMPQPESDSHD